MVRFNTFRAKDPVLAAIISMGLIFATPAMTKAQSAQGEWEEVGPAGQTAQQQLMLAPPRVTATPLGQASYRPPVEPPDNASRNVGAAAMPQQTHYIVQTGDTLPKIAMKVYGDPNRWQDLMVLNNIDNGNRIVVGQKLVTVAGNSASAGSLVAKAAVSDAFEYEVAPNEIEETAAPSVSADAAEADAAYYGQTGGTYKVPSRSTIIRATSPDNHF